MPIKRIVVCAAQVPFVHGGAEAHVDGLVEQLRRHGYLAEVVSLPFKWYPREEILAHAAAWRLLDLGESNGEPIDLAIATKFPSYFVRHPCKVAWLIHQFRGAYDLCGTPYSDLTHDERDVGFRHRLMELDTRMLGECRRVFTNAKTTADRLRAHNGIEGTPLYHPPRLASRLAGGPAGDYVLSVGRVDATKRVDLLVDAMAHVDPGIRLIVAGDGPARAGLERRVAHAGTSARIDFTGAVDDDTLVALYAGALAVAYAPFDEDFGYVTLEAFLARKPVITASDSGGPLEFVENGVTGLVTAPDAAAVADAVNDLAANRARASAFGNAGYERARAITWEGVVDALVGVA